MNHPRARHPAFLPATKSSAGPAVHIAIDKLSLHGFTEGQQQRFMQALSTALSQMATKKHDWSSLSSHHLDSIPPLQAHHGTTPEASAARLASALFDHLDGRKQERRHG